MGESRSLVERGLAEGQEALLVQAVEQARTDRERSIAEYGLSQYMMHTKRYSTAAKHWAEQSVVSFEEVALDLLHDPKALATFLDLKAQKLTDEKTQLTMVCMWMFELTLASCTEPAQARQRVRQLLEKPHVRPWLHAATACSLIASHGFEDSGLLEDVATALGGEASEELLNACLFTDKYEQALRLLDDLDESLFYDTSVALASQVPEQAVEAWASRDLDAEKLLPALLAAPDAVKFVEPVDKPSVRCFLIEKCESDDKLVECLRGASTYDLQFALRLCTRKKRFRPCVHIYREMGLYEDATELALTFDVALAKDIANSPDLPPDVARRLWLLVAKHVIADKCAVADSAALLDECPLLSIEDVLPLCPDFVVIETFKNEIVKSLDEYNGDVDGIKADLADYAKSINTIHDEMAGLDDKQLSLPADTRCALSGEKISSGPFYVFSSGLAYLESALYEYMVPHLPKDKQDRIALLRAKIDQASSTNKDDEDITLLETELESLIAAECPLTGSMMIDSIDKPLTTPELEEYWSVDAW